MAPTAPPIDVEALKERLLYDTPFYAEHLLKIVDKARRTVPLKPKQAQLRFDAAIEAQRAMGLPMRILILKCRQIGYSTWTAAKFIQRITQRANRDAIVIAQDTRTAGKLFGIGERMHRHLPVDPELPLKPEVKNFRKSNFLHFGTLLEDGSLWPDSTYAVDTANEFEAGRGQTYSEVHCSELAFWADIDRKLLGVLEAVPDEPETLVVLESTANGFNEFKELWDEAESGESGYVPFFSPWFEEPTYTRPFANEADRRDFEAQVGTGPYGDGEVEMLEESPYPLARAEPLTLEQLHWRRWKIANPPIRGDLKRFQQEYPATPQEAFISTGKQVFDSRLVQAVIRKAEQTDPPLPTEDKPGPELGILKETGHVARKGRHGITEVPTGAEWVPKSATGFGERHPYWRVWEEPQEDGQYVVALDPAGGEETDKGESAWHAIVVIDHKSREQVAEYRSRIDPDLMAREVLLAALHYNRAFVAVETTGGYGLSIARRIYLDFKWPRHLTYFRKSLDSQTEKEADRLGWDTNRVSKVVLEDGARELLREGTHGIRSRLLALELTTYVKDPRGRTGPEKNRFADLLMAWMIAEQVAHEIRPRSDRKGQRVRSMLDDATAKRWMVNR